MKAFIYSKLTSKTIAVVTNVIAVMYHNDQVIFTTSKGEIFTFNTKEVKTTTYQN